MPKRAVVIGAGINGLIAASYLHRAGLAVMLIERADVAGFRADEARVVDTCRRGTGRRVRRRWRNSEWAQP